MKYNGARMNLAYYQYVGYVGVWLVLYLLGFLVVPIALLFCTRDSERLPGWASWWSNYSDGINGTLIGENDGWVEKCGGEEQTRTYWNRFVWSAWRNPVSGASYTLLGSIYGYPVIYRYSRINRVFIERQRMGRYFQYLIHVDYPWATKKRLFLRFGWKFGSVWAGLCPLVFRISPFYSD